MHDETLSLVRGTSEPPLLELTIGEVLDLAVRQWPQGEAVVSCHQGIRLTWQDFAARVDAFAAGLLSLGLVPGDRVGIWAPNCAEWVITQFATARAGLIQVNINPAYRLSEVEYTLNKVGVKALVCADRFKSSDYVGMIETLAPELVSASGDIRAERLAHLRTVIKIGGGKRPGWLSFDDVEELSSDREKLKAIAKTLTPQDPINIQFTSGTTGLPKGATLSHRNIVNNGFFVGRAMGLRASDRLCIPVPLYHCFGMVMGNLACVVHGATMTYASDGFDPLAVLKTVEAEHCTGLFGVPTMFIAELEHPDFSRFDLSGLRTGIMAGSACPIEVMRKVIDRMHMSDVCIAYGMTETSPVSLQTTLEDTLERRVTTIGRVLPHLEVKIVDSEGRTVKRNEPGEICVRGYSVMLGYWNDPQKTAEVVDANGWMHTGDIGTLDAQGYGSVVGRIKDMIIRGGENVYPREVEEFLFGHPKIEAVQIVGLPDVKYGEEVCAWIKLRAGESATTEDIIAFCRGQIAHYKVPRYVRFVDTFPMTVTGKVQKFEIRKAMMEELGLSEIATA